MTVTTLNSLPSQITINLTQKDKDIKGTLRYTYEDARYFEDYMVSGIYNKANGTVYLQEDSVKAWKYPPTVMNFFKPEMKNNEFGKRKIFNELQVRCGKAYQRKSRFDAD